MTKKELLRLLENVKDDNDELVSYEEWSCNGDFGVNRNWTFLKNVVKIEGLNQIKRGNKNGTY